MCQIENVVRATPADTPADQLLQAFLPFMPYISMYLSGSFRLPDYLPEFPVSLYHEMGLEQLLPVPRKVIKVIPVQFIPVLLYAFFLVPYPHVQILGKPLHAVFFLFRHIL